MSVFGYGYVCVSVCEHVSEYVLEWVFVYVHVWEMELFETFF